MRSIGYICRGEKDASGSGNPELVGIAKQLRRATLRTMRQSTARTLSHPGCRGGGIFREQSSELTNPMFQASSMLDEMKRRRWTWTSPATVTWTPARRISPAEHVFRAYDIRGDAESELTDELVAESAKPLAVLPGRWVNRP